MGTYRRKTAEQMQWRGARRPGAAGAGLALAAAFSLALVAGAPAWAATARHAAHPAAKTALAAGARLNAELKSTLDAHKAKVGQKVTAVVRSNVKSHGRVIIPKGAKLYGTVTAVTRASKKNKQSAVGVLFYRAVTKHHRVIPLRAAISRVLFVPGLAANGMANMGMDSPMGGMAGGGMGGGMAGPRGGMVGGAMGGAVGGVANTAGGAVGGMGKMAGDAAGSAAGGLGRMGANAGADAQLNGVWRDSNGHPFAIRFPRLGSTAALYGQGSFLVSRGGNFKLNSGSQLQLETLGGGASASGAAHASAGTH